MSASPETIWRVPAYLPYLQPALTDAAVAEAEAKIGFRLPDAYLALLRIQNGGYLRYGLPELVHSQIHGIGPHYPSITRFDWEECREWVSYELDGLVPFDGDGHWYLCLDYRREGANPAVTYIDIECDHESPIAPSFADYLSLLQIEVDESEYVMLAVPEIEEVKSAIAGKLGVEFKAPDSFAHGYPIHSACGGSASKREWIWISSNLAPRGFVRVNDPRFEELRDLRPGEAPRYPELPAASLLLTVTEGLRSDVLRACAELGIEVRPLTEYVA
jgi:hypothetical protein